MSRVIFRSLFARVFLMILLAQIILAGGLSAIFVLAVQRSVESWNVDRGRQLHNQLIPEIIRVHRTTGRLPEMELHGALQHFITGSVSALVTNAGGDPVYLNVAGQHISIHDPATLEEALESLRPALGPPGAVLAAGEPVGYLFTETRRFREDVTNQQLLQSLFSLTMGGTAAALVGSLLVAFIFSRLLVAQAREVARGITNLAAGERHVSFSTRGPVELQEIAQSAGALQEQLFREETLRRQWTEDIAHDLRTPVTALKTQLEGMTEGYIAVTPERTALLFQEVLQIERLVSGLRELSSLESPESTFSRCPVDPRSFLAEVRAAVAPRARDAAIELVVDPRGGTFSADEHLLHRAVANIVDNALRHAVPVDAAGAANRVADDASSAGTAPRAAVSIRTWRDAGGFWMEVANTGTIAEEEMARVFDRFYRGANARETPGSGLGLSIARAAVERHGGAIGMSCDGIMTRVRIRLPG